MKRDITPIGWPTAQRITEGGKGIEALREAA